MPNLNVPPSAPTKRGRWFTRPHLLHAMINGWEVPAAMKDLPSPHHDLTYMEKDAPAPEPAAAGSAGSAPAAGPAATAAAKKQGER